MASSFLSLVHSSLRHQNRLHFNSADLFQPATETPIFATHHIVPPQENRTFEMFQEIHY